MKTIVALVSGLILSGASFAQQATVAAGGVATGSGGSVSYSIGQVAYAAVNSSSGSINQGVQQPHQVIVTTVKEVPGIQASIMPNPVSENLVLTLNNEPSAGMACQLFDLSGKLVQSQSIGSTKVQINMSLLAPSVYTLCITESDQVKGTFKVIKK